MSENLKRSNPDFSKYDSMSIGELEEILRADAMGPERDDSDVDEILYVMEVLAKKRRQNGIAGKTAFEAYQEFQQHYLPMVEEESKPQRKSNVIPFRRIAAVAASLVLVFSLTTTANAFCFKDVWDAVVVWAQETFSFSMGMEVGEPKADSELEYESLQDALAFNNVAAVAVPTFIPDGYILSEILIEQNPLQQSYGAIYTLTDSSLRITIKTYIPEEAEQFEKSSDDYIIFHNNGIDYFLFENINTVQAVWLDGSYECCISGSITLEEIKNMIVSIRKG